MYSWQVCRAPPFCVGERSAAPVFYTESTGVVDVSVVLLNKCDYVKLLFIYYLHTNAINIALTLGDKVSNGRA